MKRSGARGSASDRRSERFSNGKARGQWAAGCVLVLGALAGAAAPARSAGAALPNSRPTPSGKPVPRWVSTRFATVNARGGPGDDYRLLWVYRAQGLPLQVIAETDDWRRVCDPEGAVAWVHRRTVGETPRAMRIIATPLPLRARADEASAPVALLNARATAQLGPCIHGWCRLSVDHATGWVREAQVWGTAQAAQCGVPAASRSPSRRGLRPRTSG